MVRRSTCCGIFGLPQSRLCENDQSKVTIRPTQPAARVRSIRATIASLPPDQYSWKKVAALAATTSSTGLLANDDNPIAIPRAAAARATATSPSGCTACTPVGEISTGIDTCWPSTVVLRSRCTDDPAICGANPSSANAASLSAIVLPRSEPAISAAYTVAGSRFFARRWATATDSNHRSAIRVPIPATRRPAAGRSRRAGSLRRHCPAARSEPGDRA